MVHGHRTKQNTSKAKAYRCTEHKVSFRQTKQQRLHLTGGRHKHGNSMPRWNRTLSVGILIDMPAEAQKYIHQQLSAFENDWPIDTNTRTCACAHTHTPCLFIVCVCMHMLQCSSLCKVSCPADLHTCSIAFSTRKCRLFGERQLTLGLQREPVLLLGHETLEVTISP